MRSTVLLLASVLSLGSAHHALAADPPTPRWPFIDAAPTVAKPAQGGIGLVLESHDGALVAGQVTPGGPAAKAGVEAGDELTTLDGWTVPPNSKVPDVVGRVRGAPGSTLRLGIRRRGAPLELQVVRVVLDRLFPPTAHELLTVQPGVAVLASGGEGTLGLQFTSAPDTAKRVAYTWRLAAGEARLDASGAREGAGLVTVDAQAGAQIQVADWRLELKRDGEQVYVAKSSLPVHLPPRGQWLQLAPPFASYMTPRASPARKSTRWEGELHPKLRVQLGGKPLASHRLTLRLHDGSQALDTRSVQTDAQGVAELALPPGRYRVLNLSPSTPGGLPDAAFEAELTAQARDMALDPTAASVPTLELAAKTADGTDVADWATEPRVGQGLPQLEVKKWLLGHPQPKDLKGQVLLLYVWATWCGPCRMTAPAVAQVAAKLKQRSVQVVAASIDRDEAALDEYARDELPGAPPIAWIGPDGMDKLGLDSVPTFIAVDGTGRIRGLRKGGGWSPDALAAWLEKVLDGSAK